MTKTNTMAILSLIFAFVFFPLGLIFGIIALKQIKQNNEDGKAIALAGIIISAIPIILLLILIVLFLILVFIKGFA